MTARRYLSAVVDGLPARIVDELANMDEHTRRVYMEGREDGRVEGLLDGYRQGYAACNEEIARLQRAAVQVVHGMAKIPLRDIDADHARAARKAEYWARRRGEVA